MSTAITFADCRDCYCLASRMAARSITAVYDGELRPYGLRITQFSVLAMLVLAGALPITALAKALGLDRTTLTRNLAPLESKGWVRVRPDASDARTRVVSVTPAGEGVARKALPGWRRAQQAVAGAIGPAGGAALHRLASTRLP